MSSLSFDEPSPDDPAKEMIKSFNSAVLVSSVISVLTIVIMVAAFVYVCNRRNKIRTHIVNAATATAAVERGGGCRSSHHGQILSGTS